MLLPPFEYFAPKTVKEAIALAAQYGEKGKVLAGGTDLIVMMKDKLLKPEVLIDISGIEEIRGINYVPGQGLTIGAATKVDEIEHSALIQRHWKALSEAAGQLGSVQVRTMATLGGNSCHASPAAETPPPLVALGAKVTINGPAGERELPLEEFILGNRKTALQTGEILTHFTLPEPAPRSASTYLYHGLREAMEIDMLNVAVYMVLKEDRKTCKEAKIALGAVAPRPLRATDAEKHVSGKEIEYSVLEEAGRLAAAQASPISDIRASAEYRKEVLEVLVRRALAQVFEAAQAFEPAQGEEGLA